MAFTPIIINLNLNKRLPTGRPLTLEEGDENWDKLELAFADLVNQLNISLGDAFSELIPNNSGIMFSDGIVLGSGRLTGTTDWFICDGQTQNGIVTPDLRNLMIVGSGDEFNTGDNGGIDQAPDHSHTDPESGFHGLTADENGTHDHPLKTTENIYTEPLSGESGGDSFPTAPIAGGVKTGTSGLGTPHTHPTGGQTSDDGAHDNKPRYYALVPIKYCPGI